MQIPFLRSPYLRFAPESTAVYGVTEQVGHSLTGKYPIGVFSDSVSPLWIPYTLSIR